MKHSEKILVDTPEYHACLQREYDRERRWRETLQGAFESSMTSFDAMTDSFGDPSKCYAFSDHGLGAQAIADYLDGVGTLSWLRQRIDTARKRVRRANPKLLTVFNLVLKNGTNRKESIWQLGRIIAKSNSKPRSVTSAT